MKKITISILTLLLLASLTGCTNLKVESIRNDLDVYATCHCVIHNDHTIGGYNKGTAEKIKLLKKEGAILV